MKEIEIDGRKIEIATTIDAVGLFCPMPIVQLNLALEGLEGSEVVEVFADDAGFEEDVINWCKEKKHRVLSLKKNEEKIFAAYVEKFQAE